MLDPKYVRENVDLVVKELARRGQEINFEVFLKLDERRRTLLQEVEALRHLRKEASEEYGRLKKGGEENPTPREEMRDLGKRIGELDEEVRKAEGEIEAFLLTIPNIPHASVATGRGPEDNPEVRKWGKIGPLSFPAKPHWEIGEALGLLDFERGAKIAGSGFTLSWGSGAFLERALMNFMIEVHTREHGYKELLPPFIVNRASMTGTGQLPKFEEDLFKVNGMEYYLIPTAEVPLTNVHAGEILAKEMLPLRYVAYSPCFRREAGAAGRDTRGIVRQHQFNKVELVRFSEPEASYDELEVLTRDAEKILTKLGLPYRVVSLCSGDLGFAAAKTYDIEVWLPGQGEFKEISSCSNFEDFQARRANIRYRPDQKSKPRYVHTLNGSGLAIGRTVVAILENCQQEDGSVLVPEALRPYMGGLERIVKQ